MSLVKFTCCSMVLAFLAGSRVGCCADGGIFNIAASLKMAAARCGGIAGATLAAGAYVALGFAMCDGFVRALGIKRVMVAQL